jgi:ribosomal protein S21
MTWVRVKENEPIDSAIRRFKKQCEKAGKPARRCRDAAVPMATPRRRELRDST